MWSKRHVLAALASAGALPRRVLAAEPDARPPGLLSPAEQRTFRALLGDYFRAWSPGEGALDLDAVARFYAQDPRDTYFGLFPPAAGFVGWPAYAEGMRRTVYDALADYVAVPNEDLRLRRVWTVAWTTVTFRATGRFRDGRPLAQAGRHTAVWERRERRWLIVHEHLSAPLGAPPAA